MYICLIITINIIFLLFKKNKEKALFISFILITVIASLRKYTVGIDTKQFYDAYYLIGNTITWNYTIFRYEPAFFYLCKILNYITKNSQILIIFTSVFINYSVYNFIKKNSSNYMISTILYVIMNIYFSYMNTMRQALATAVLLYGFEYLKEKKYIKYIITILIATLFHNVAWAQLLLIVSLIILSKKKGLYLIFPIITIILFFEYNKLFSFLGNLFGYAGYANGDFGVSNYFGSLIAFLEAIIVFGVNYIYIVSNKKSKLLYSSRMQILNIATMIYLLFLLLVMRMNIFNRISGLYSIYSIITIPELLMEIKKINFRDYYIMKWFILIIYISSFVVINMYRPEWFGCVPYDFFWN